MPLVPPRRPRRPRRHPCYHRPHRCRPHHWHRHRCRLHAHLPYSLRRAIAHSRAVSSAPLLTRCRHHTPPPSRRRHHTAATHTTAAGAVVTARVADLPALDIPVRPATVRTHRGSGHGQLPVCAGAPARRRRRPESRVRGRERAEGAVTVPSGWDGHVHHVPGQEVALRRRRRRWWGQP